MPTAFVVHLVMAQVVVGRKNQFFLPGDGIDREVIQADICKYLDNDATVRPGQYNVTSPPHARPVPRGLQRL